MSISCRERGDQRNGARHVGVGERHVALAGADGLRLLEVLGAVGHDPKVAIGLVDHGDDHAARAQIETELHGHQHNGEQDPDQRHHQADAVMEQVTKGQR